uniref:Uncharacterized protein n=1 Tax=Oryza nivara TaxID=4536 RepID=A0A0E0GQL3_ORYNI
MPFGDGFGFGPFQAGPTPTRSVGKWRAPSFIREYGQLMRLPPCISLDEALRLHTPPARRTQMTAAGEGDRRKKKLWRRRRKVASFLDFSPLR